MSLDYENHDHQVGILKADTVANIIKSVELGKTDTVDYPAWFNSLEYINDSTVYIGGFMDYLAFWTTEPSFVELYLIDTNLNLLGYRQFGGDINYQLYGITATADGVVYCIPRHIQIAISIKSEMYIFSKFRAIA
jgi:hypothetical protein